jgi:hypothetical protein
LRDAILKFNKFSFKFSFFFYNNKCKLKKNHEEDLEKIVELFQMQIANHIDNVLYVKAQAASDASLKPNDQSPELAHGLAPGLAQELAHGLAPGLVPDIVQNQVHRNL